MATKISGGELTLSPATKGIEIHRSGTPRYEKNGNDHFTWFGSNSTGAFSTSGYIAAALRWKCEQFSLAPFCVLKTSTDARGRYKWDLQEAHPALQLLRYPCGTKRGVMTCAEWKARMVNSWELDGNAYAVRLPNGLGQFTHGLRYLPHYRVTIERDFGSKNPIDRYIYTNDSGQRLVIPPEFMLHWKQGVDPENEALGYSPLKSVLRDIGTEAALSRYLERASLKGGAPARAAMPEKAEDSESWDDEFVKTLGKDYRAASDGGLWLLDFPAKIVEMGANPQQMTVDKLALVPKEKIIAVLGVDPALLHLTVGYGDSKSTDKKELQAAGWKSSILPMAASLCERLNLDVLSDFGDIKTEKIDLDIRGVWALQEDVNDKQLTNQKNYLADIVTKNEAREVLDKDPIEDGDKTHNQYPQLINSNAQDAILNGTNGKLPNETDRSNPKGKVEVEK